MTVLSLIIILILFRGDTEEFAERPAIESVISKPLMRLTADNLCAIPLLSGTSAVDVFPFSLHS